MVQMRKQNDGKFFQTTKRGEIQELKEELHANDKAKQKDAVKKVIANMTVGKDVSALFADVVNCIQTDNIELKKLVYLYVMNYAKAQPELAILAINTFRKDASDTNPLIRSLAVRTMGCIRLDQVTEYLLEPLRKCCQDPDPYVRKTSAICIPKVYDINPELVEDQGFLDILKDMLSDPNPMVVANAVAGLAEITETSKRDLLDLDNKMTIDKLKAALNECNEWGQVFILDALSTYVPVSSNDAESITERVTARLSHANPAVVLAAIKVILKAMEYVDSTETLRMLAKKLNPPLVTLLSSEPEVQYVSLRNIRLIVQKRPGILAADVKMFFCKYNDPVYVKLEKVDIMVMLVTEKNFEQVLLELKEYATGHCPNRHQRNHDNNNNNTTSITNTNMASKHCEELLPGLDEDIAEYISGILDDDGALDPDSVDDTTEMIAGLLGEYCEETDEDASDKAAALIARLTQKNGGGKAASTVAKVEDLPVKRVGISLADQLKIDDDLVYGDVKRNTVNTIMEENNGTSNTNSKPKSKKGKSNKPTAADVATAQIAEIESELHEARVAAVKARAKLGAYRGSLDAKAFTLPNPGGGAPLLEDAACRLVWGKRYGLIGRNGMGKSTMLRAFAARRVGDVPAQVSVHYVSQEVNLTEEQRGKTPIMCVVDADIERTLLKDEIVELEAKAAEGALDAAGSVRQGELIARLDEIGGDSAPRRAEALLANLGFSEELRSRPLSQLSGGWRVRTMLAAAIFAKPDLLLLDEPTNHLSILAVMWLARELATSDTWKERIVVIVSHDRHFMDEVCTDCLHISGAAKKLTQARGNYSVWHKRRKEQQALFAKEQKARQEEIDRLREYAGHGFKYGGSASQINKMGMKAKQADKLEEAHAEHAEELSALQEDVELPIHIAAGGELDGYVVQLQDVGFGYPGATPARLFQHCEFGITSKSRIVLLGENGNGKTTLVKLIMGELQPCEGNVRRSPHARYALVNQHHADQIDLSLTPLEFLASKFPGDGSYDHMIKLRAHLASCGVTSGSNAASKNASVKDLQTTPASALSGGQRSRVALAAVSYARPHVLVLDEPTNNLDLESVATLAESVRNFKGAVICVSHDQFFVQTVANEAWVVNDGKVKRVESFEAYRNKQLKLLDKNESK